jgi:beta-glucosidase-like glycosyl hydrolase
MTDQTNPAASMPITMEGMPEEKRRAASNASLLEILVGTINTHIYNEVQAQLESQVTLLVARAFNNMLEARNALKLMDDALEHRIDEKITQAIEDHEGTEEHHDHANIEQIAADQARETLKEYARTQQGWVTEDQVKDIITEHVDEELDMIDWDEKVKDVLREML